MVDIRVDLRGAEAKSATLQSVPSEGTGTRLAFEGVDSESGSRDRVK